jgi:hypothetical protein
MKLLLLCALSGCFLLTGCPAYSVHPLYIEQDAVEEPALEGTWGTPRPSDKETISFQKSGGHEYSLSIFHPDTKVTENYTAHVVRLEGLMYMDVIAEGQAIGDAKLDGLMGVIPTHLILKVKISRDDLVFGTWKDDEIRKQSAGGAQRWTISWSRAACS